MGCEQRQIKGRRRSASTSIAYHMAMILSGWKRIGIVASIGWILGAGYYTLVSVSAADSRFHVGLTLRCEEARPNGMTESEQTKWQERCDSYLPTGERLHQELQAEWLEAAMVAFIPVPLAWGLVYLVLFLVGWIKRGFHSL
jgi:hypothetical protein